MLRPCLLVISCMDDSFQSICYHLAIIHNLPPRRFLKSYLDTMNIKSLHNFAKERLATYLHTLSAWVPAGTRLRRVRLFQTLQTIIFQRTLGAGEHSRRKPWCLRKTREDSKWLLMNIHGRTRGDRAHGILSMAVITEDVNMKNGDFVI